MVTIIVEGDKDAKAYIAEVNRRITNASKQLPKDASADVKRSIKTLIRGAPYHHKGQYFRRTGKGLAESIMKRKTGKTTWIVTPDPNMRSLTTPSGRTTVPPYVYANYVEFGTNHSQAKHYFRDGLRRAIPHVDKRVRNESKNIVRR